MAKAKKAPVSKKRAPKKAAVAAQAAPVLIQKKGGGKGLLIAACMIGAVVLIGAQIYFKARKEASQKFDMVRTGRNIATGMSDGQGMSPLQLQGDKEDNLFFLDGQGTDPARLQKFSAGCDFIKKYVPKTPQQMIAGAVDLDVDKDGNPRVLLRTGEVVMLDKNLGYLRTLATQVASPSGIGIMPDGRMLIASKDSNKIVVFDAAGQKTGEFGAPGTKSGDIANPVRLRVTQDGLVAVMELVSSGLHMKVFSPEFKQLVQFDLAKLQWCEPVKLGVTSDGKMFCNDHMGDNGLMVWNLKDGEFLGASKGTKDNVFFISPGSSGADKYTRSVYLHSVNGLTKCLMPEGK